MMSFLLTTKVPFGPEGCWKNTARYIYGIVICAFIKNGLQVVGVISGHGAIAMPHDGRGLGKY